MILKLYLYLFLSKNTTKSSDSKELALNYLLSAGIAIP